MFTKENFPNFFRIVPSENAFNPPRLSLLREFNWTRVGTIYQNEPRYSLAHNRQVELNNKTFATFNIFSICSLVAELDTLGYEVVEAQSFTDEVNTALVKLKEKDTRIILGLFRPKRIEKQKFLLLTKLGNFNERYARLIFCEAYKLEMFGRKYQWLIMGTYRDDWWKNVDLETNCTIENIEEALEQTILTDLLPLSTSDDITIAGIVLKNEKKKIKFCLKICF